METSEPLSTEHANFRKRLADYMSSAVADDLQRQVATLWSEAVRNRLVDMPSSAAGESLDSPAGRDIHEKAAAYDALLDALDDDMDRRLAEINATLDRLAA